MGKNRKSKLPIEPPDPLPNLEDDPLYQAEMLEKTLLSELWSDEAKISSIVSAIRKGVELPLAAPEELILAAREKIKRKKMESSQLKFKRCTNKEEQIALIDEYIRNKKQDRFPSSIPAELLIL